MFDTPYRILPCLVSSAGCFQVCRLAVKRWPLQSGLRATTASGAYVALVQQRCRHCFVRLVVTRLRRSVSSHWEQPRQRWHLQTLDVCVAPGQGHGLLHPVHVDVLHSGAQWCRSELVPLTNLLQCYPSRAPRQWQPDHRHPGAGPVDRSQLRQRWESRGREDVDHVLVHPHGPRVGGIYIPRPDYCGRCGHMVYIVDNPGRSIPQVLSRESGMSQSLWYETGP